MKKYPVDVTNVTNETVGKSEYAGNPTDILIFEIRDAILNYCIENKTKARKITAKITPEGMLSINEKNILRVAPLPKCCRKVEISDKCVYFENRVLARQESYDL